MKTFDVPSQSGGSDVVKWLKSFFNFHTGIRAAAVLVGVLLIIVAVVALLSKSKSVQQSVSVVASKAKEAAGTLAVASGADTLPIMAS